MEENKQELNMPVAEVEPVVSEEPKKKAKVNFVVCIVCLALMAIAGVAFGAYAMIAKDRAVAEASENCGGERPAPVPGNEPEETPEDLLDETKPEKSAQGISNPEDYIIIGEWGVKIKIPDNLISVSYRYNVGAGYTSLEVLGVKRGGQYFPEFANPTMNSSSLGIVWRTNEDTRNSEMGEGEAPVLKLDGYNYFYAHPQDVYSTDEDEKQWEVESVELIQEMLDAPSSYSRI